MSGLAALQPPEPERSVVAEIRRIYAAHCPAKSAHDVEKILGRFAGREAELLKKARAKYGGTVAAADHQA